MIFYISQTQQNNPKHLHENNIFNRGGNDNFFRIWK